MAQRTWRRLTLAVPARDAEVASALLGAVAGVAVVLEQREGARAVAASAYVHVKRAPRALRVLRARLRALQRDGILRAAAVAHAAVHDEDWSQTWKRYFRPFEIARGLHVVPPWESQLGAPSGAQALLVDPGMAFGTGQHATTRLAVRLLLPLVKPRDVVIDAGCGSGIVGMAAALRGASVYAFDNDAIAVAATRLNFERNDLRPAAVARADRIPATFPKADIIVANITSETLQEFAPDLTAHLKPGGRLVTSGITARNRLATLFAFARAGLAFVEERRGGEWFAYLHQAGARSTRANLEEAPEA
jgi:ribosomal protein L11 methyltransferase